ncbi:hypothetical protein DSO57_1039732 [Entomophthora muscae]|uniref:Uncharacterized protein n=1 Tax=Entomophthora muscae TaxID=34485 RepID=A0ACC2U9A9_9FUNG|nr:hypothetical protein DSO57_1039732 [Entomophthora muscae]
MSISEQAVVYATLILADDKIEPTADKITTLVKACNVSIEPIWASLFAKALEGKDISELLMNVGSGAGAAPAAAAPAAGASQEAPKVAAKEEVKEESDEDMGFGLFD